MTALASPSAIPTNRIEDNGRAASSSESDFSRLLEKHFRPEVHDKIPDPVAYSQMMGEQFARANIAGCSKPAEGICLAWALLEMGIGWVEFASKYHMQNGKPTLQAHEILARIRKSGNKVAWINQGDDKVEASANFTIDGETTLVRYTWQNAVDARITGFEKPDSAWQKGPAAMLRAALLRKASKMLCPEILTGDVDPEEFVGGDNATAAEPVKPRRTKAETEKRAEELQATATATGPVAPIHPGLTSTTTPDGIAANDPNAVKPVETASFDAPKTQTALPGTESQAAANPAVTSATSAATVDPSANEFTVTLLEIEATIGELGMTKSQLEAGLKAKNPGFTSLDALPLPNLKALLANVRAKVVKK